MLWSLLKILVFIAVAAGLVYGTELILETPGEVTLAFAGREITLQPLGFLLAALVVMVVVLILLKIAGLIVAILRYLFTNDRDAITRFFDRGRERAGYDALGKAVMALAAGDSRMALLKAQRANAKLNRPELTRLVLAQAAEAAGSSEKAAAVYKDMLGDDKSRFLGIQGLLRQQLEAGNTDTALKLAEKAVAIHPKNNKGLDTLFELQSKKADWAGARATLSQKVRNNALPRDVGKRREAILALAEAMAAEAEGNTARARDSAYLANRLVPDLIPAAAMAGRLHAEAGEARQAAKIVKAAWTVAPHPDLAAAFAAIAPTETPAERQSRFAPILAIQPDHTETRLVSAELALAAEDFPGARRALGDLIETAPTTRSLTIMAAIEKGQGASDEVVRGWLAKALSAPRGEAWVCSVCNDVQGTWVPVCGNCGAFDSLVWTRPPETGHSDGTTAMLPLIIGTLGETSAGATQTAEDVTIDAEPTPAAGAAKSDTAAA